MPTTPTPDVKPATDPALQPVTAPVRPIMAPVIKPCLRPFATSDVLLDGTGDFARALRNKLKTHRQVIVDLASPYPTQGDPPSELAPWLAEVKSSGGSVTIAQYCQGTRGFFTKLLAKIFGSDPGQAYKAARDYDVVLHADALDRVVTQAEFVPRTASPS